MGIKNVEGLTNNDIRDLVAQGGKFVMYKYCISIVIMTFNRPSDFYFIRPGESRIVPGLGYLFISFFLGWWGIPWGPIYTISNISSILGGGKDYTHEILAHINQNDPIYGVGTTYNISGHIQSPNQETANTYQIP